ncbi:MAG: peptidase inhibitor family I36 protein, partial [Pseudolysinimonas sp.]
MTPRRIAIAASIAILLGSSLLVAAPASASTGDCPLYRACVWKDTNYETAGSGTNSKSFSQYLDDYTGYSWSSGQGGINDNVTSVYNHGAIESTRWFRDVGGLGGYFTLAPSAGDGNLANTGGSGGVGHNDWVSS